MSKSNFNDGTEPVEFWGMKLSKPLLWIVFTLAALAILLIFFNSQLIYLVKRVFNWIISLFTKEPVKPVVTPAEQKAAVAEYAARTTKLKTGLKLG